MDLPFLDSEVVIVKREKCTNFVSTFFFFFFLENCGCRPTCKACPDFSSINAPACHCNKKSSGTPVIGLLLHLHMRKKKRRKKKKKKRHGRRRRRRRRGSPKLLPALRDPTPTPPLHSTPPSWCCCQSRSSECTRFVNKSWSQSSKLLHACCQHRWCALLAFLQQKWMAEAVVRHRCAMSQQLSSPWPCDDWSLRKYENRKQTEEKEQTS